jgi:hypothetical protein
VEFYTIEAIRYGSESNELSENSLVGGQKKGGEGVVIGRN